MAEPLSSEEVRRQSRERAVPSLRNPNWLVLRQRRRIFDEGMKRLPTSGLAVLDVGGRLQPYREALGTRVTSYLAVDPETNPLVSAAANAEALPFREGQFDLVICTQVLEYVPEPARAVAEIRRVLREGGYAFISAPAMFIRDHEKEYWRFLPEGLRYLLREFEAVDVLAEGNSVAGLFRTFNVFVVTFIKPKILAPLMTWTVVPVLNLAGAMMEKLGGNNDHCTANFSVWARK
jgi:SAM-dependent methyltransferase